MKSSVQNFYTHLKKTSPFYKTVFTGSIRHETAAYFLESVRHLVYHTPIHLALAVQEAEKRGYTELAEYFRVKLKEEAGHDEWAKADLKKLAVLSPKTASTRSVAPAVLATLKRNEETIKRDPYLYLVHIFFAEYFTVIEGPEFMDSLKKVGIKPTMVSVVNNHVELDVDHVDEWETVMDQLISTGKYGAAFQSSLEKSFRLYEQFCADLETFNAAA